MMERRRWMLRTFSLGCALACGAPLLANEPLPGKLASASSGRGRDLTFDDIKFDMKKGDPFKRSLLTAEIEQLEGKSIRIRGYMLPTFQTSGITRFILVRDNLECCFGPGAALYDCVVVNMESGKSAKFTTRPIAVEGTFTIKELAGPEGKPDKPLAIYEMTATLAK